MRNNEQGYSLVELLIVITILGVVATVAVPDITTTGVSRLDMAAAEIADAMRFARSESMRESRPRAFDQQTSQQKIRVLSLNTDASPWSPVYDVYHPLSKQLYDVDLKNHSFASIDSISHNRIYRGICNTPERVYFDINGAPWCTDPETVLLDQLSVTLTLGAHTRIVTLHGITGRVTIQ